jgi:hypothetical protein
VCSFTNLGPTGIDFLLIRLSCDTVCRWHRKKLQTITGTTNEIESMDSDAFNALMHSLADEASIEEMVV